MEKPNSIERSGSMLDDLYPEIYHAERLITYFKENYFFVNSEAFDNDRKAQNDFVFNYEQMEAQVYAISELIFKIRLNTEFALGVDTDITRLHIKNENHLQGNK